MKKILSISLLLLICLSTVYAENYGIICGISNYAVNNLELKYSAKNATAIYNTLIKSGNWKIENLKLLTDEQVTKKNLTDTINLVKSKMQDPDKEKFLFFFSGFISSVGVKDQGFPDEKDGLDEFIYMYDGEKLIDDDFVELIGVPSCTKSSNRVVIFDAYKSTPKNEIPETKSDIFDELDFRPNVRCLVDVGVVFTSCKYSQLISKFAVDHTMPNFLNMALSDGSGGAKDENGDGWISIRECYNYINSVKVPKLFQYISGIQGNQADKDITLIKAWPNTRIALKNGDVNKDGKIDMADVLLIGNYVTGQKVENFHVENADINCDKRVDIVDAFELIRKVNDPTYNIACPASH